MVFLCELNCSDIIQHGQALFHLFKNNGQVVHAFRICSFESNCFKQQKQQFDIHVSLYGVFQPPYILTALPNRLPPAKFLNPLTKNFSRSARAILFLGSFQNLIRLCKYTVYQIVLSLVLDLNLSSIFICCKILPWLWSWGQGGRVQPRSCADDDC